MKRTSSSTVFSSETSEAPRSRKKVTSCGGSTEEPWSSASGEPSLELEYEAGGAYAATDGESRISIRVDGESRDPIEVASPGLQELTTHERTERHTLRLEPSPGLLVCPIQFAAGVPAPS